MLSLAHSRKVATKTKLSIRIPTKPQTLCYTTLWNINVRNRVFSALWFLL